MSHGVYHLEPDVANLSQLAVVVMPAKNNLVGGMMPGSGLAVDTNGVVALQPAAMAKLGGVKIGANVTAQPDGTISVPGGTVTSVAIAAPPEFTVTGSPVTGAGVLALSKASQAANQVYAGPSSGSAAAPVFRALVEADLPLRAWQSYTPTLTVVNGAPSNVSFQLAQWIKNGPTVDVVIVVSLTFTLKPSELHLSLPVAMVGSSGWPAHAIGGLTGAATLCWAYLDPSLGIVVTAGASGTFSNGASQFQVDVRYRMA
jgi:hypothetical protein